MMKVRYTVLLFPAFALLTWAPFSYADEKSPPDTGKTNDLKISTFPAAAATIEGILNTAVRNISRRYNLNETQTRYTDEMMKTEVNRFLLEHEDEVWPIIRDLLSTQVMGKPPDDSNEMRALGQAARPLAKLAQEAILQANRQWRDILSEDQKKIHDFDLANMDKQFEHIEAGFRSWEEGNRTQNPIFNQNSPRVVKRTPPRPVRPPEKKLQESPVVESLRITTLFDTFVEEFIKDYILDESQIETARSILKEFKAKARDFKNSKKREFTLLANDQKKAIEQRDRKKLKLVEAERKKLLGPVHELFGQMEERLTGLLTTTQRDRYVANQKGVEDGAAKRPKNQPSRKKGVKPKEKVTASGKHKSAGQADAPAPAEKSEEDDS